VSGAVDLDDEVRALEGLGLEALRWEWRRRYGAPPQTRSADLIRRLLAWRVQADAQGDLDAETRARLRTTALPRSLDRRLRPGVRMSRDWRGRRYEVEVVEDGFVHAGARYKSLSQVARAITGTSWNGPRFFGLRQGEAR